MLIFILKNSWGSAQRFPRPLCCPGRGEGEVGGSLEEKKHLSISCHHTGGYDPCICKVRAWHVQIYSQHSSDRMKCDFFFFFLVHLNAILLRIRIPGFAFQARVPSLHYLGYNDIKMAPKKMMEPLFQISSLMHLMVNGAKSEM